MFSNTLLAVGIFMAINGVFISLQNRRLAKEMLDMRTHGELLVGNQRGFLLLNKVIILLSVDKKGIIRKARKIDRLGPLRIPRVDVLPLEGIALKAITKENCRMNYATWKAYQCASAKYERRGE